MNNQLWYFLIEGKVDEDTGRFGNFYSYGQHLGDALKTTFRDAKTEGFGKPNLIQASLLTKFNEIENGDELIKLSEKVFMRQSTHSFPYQHSDSHFTAPVGITNSVEDGDYEMDLIKENFVAYGKDENGIFEFELVVSKEKLEEVFLKSLGFIPKVDGFWIYIQGHWDNVDTELWVAKHFVDKDKVLNFLKKQEKNTLENGYIKIVIHSIVGETNLTLDDHKKIQLHTKDEAVFNDFIRQIINLGFKQTKDFYNIEWGYPHWHYRPAESLTRKCFITMLKENQFELIDKWGH